MKKLSAFLCVILVAVAMSACSAFHDNTTKTYPQANPSQSTIFLQVKGLPINSTIDTELATWKAAVLTYNAAITEEGATKVIDVQYAVEANGVYKAELTIQNVPASTATKIVRPFKITYRQTIYNPLALLPASDVFTYNVLFSSARRHSYASTEEITTDENGEYVYFWTDATPIELVDFYPNRPLYCLFIFLGAALVGVAVYLVSRYYDCKKRKNQL